MARTVAEINSYIVDRWVENAASIGVTVNPDLWSKRNLLRLFIYSVAIGISLLEQLMDEHEARIEQTSDRSAAASSLWLQQKMFEFQYSETDPQFVSLIDDTPQYAVIDTSLRIITACSVTSVSSGDVTLKCAKTVNGAFAALAINEKSSAQGYVDTIGTAGIDYTVESKNPDQLYVDVDLYFQGQFSATIKAATISAYASWLQQQFVTKFGGQIKMSDLEGMFRNIPGMNDVVLKNVRGRKDSDAFESGIVLINNETLIFRQYNSDAGYVVPETTIGMTPDDSFNFISE